MSLGDYLNKSKITAIEGIDTRKLTLHIRDKGAMRSGIFFDTDGAVDKLMAHPKMEGLDLASGVSCSDPYDFSTIDKNKPLIGVFDFGVKLNILRLLDSHGFSVKVYPGKTPLQQVLKDKVRLCFYLQWPWRPGCCILCKRPCKRHCKRKHYLHSVFVSAIR